MEFAPSCIYTRGNLGRSLPFQSEPRSEDLEAFIWGDNWDKYSVYLKLCRRGARICLDTTFIKVEAETVRRECMLDVFDHTRELVERAGQQCCIVGKHDMRHASTTIVS